MKPAILILIILSSCSSLKKMSSKNITKSDSTAVTTKQAFQVKKSDSTGKAQETGAYTRETIYQYDTVYLPGRVEIKYVPRIIRVVESGTYAKTEQAQVNKSDSSGQHETAQVEVKKEVKIKEAEKTKKVAFSIGHLAILLAIMAVIVGGYLWFKRKDMVIGWVRKLSGK